MYRTFNKDFESLTINNASPVLLGVKPSCLLILSKSIKGYKKWLEDIRKLGLDAYPMYCLSNKIAVLIYDNEHLLEHLNAEGAREYLESIGYNLSLGLTNALRTLKIKLRNYQFSKDRYPHEIGVFLGYPLEDVVDFDRQIKPCKLSGYWKVYNDTNRAMEIINSYNKAKKLALNMYYSGYGIQDIVKLRGAV